MVTASWFVTASEARNNIVKDIAVHGEISALEMQVLLAVQRGDYEVTVSGGTPMTENSATISHVFSVDPASNTLLIPNHGYATGDIVVVSSTGELPPPLQANVPYYVIYIDSNHIKLATTKARATAGAAINIDLNQGVTDVVLGSGGSGYLAAPSVSFSGGDPDQTAAARAVLQSSGSVYDVSLLTESAGFVSTPTAVVSPSGSGAVAGAVTCKVVSTAVNFGGSGYNVNDLLSLLTGVGTQAVFRVSAVNGGSVVSVVIVNAGNYTTLPSLAASITTTSGTGAGCNLNLVMGISNIAIVDGGLNYVNPPLVEITGGGGAGATARATLVGGVVSGFVVTNPGSGFNNPAGVAVSITAGGGATAVVQLNPTGVAGVVLTDPGGADYLNPPSVNLTVPGTGASVGTVLLKTVHVTLRNAGVGYAVGDQLLVSGGVGTANTIIQVLTVNNQGVVLTFNIINNGLYSSLPTLISNNVYGGSGTGASFDLSMGVASIAVTTGGNSYVVPPLVIISGGGATSPASAYSIISSGSVASFAISDPGAGYVSVPSVSVTMGSGATAAATLVPSSIDQVVVINPGSGYTVPPIVQITGGGGTGATAEATISGGSVDNIILTNPGSGYTSNPSIQLLGDGVNASAGIARFLTPIASVSVINEGSNYVLTPTVTFGGGGTASAYAVMNPTSIAAVRITASGADYTADPLILFTDGPGQIDAPLYPTTKANRQFEVAGVEILDSGSGYQSPPAVQFSAPQAAGGTVATATTTLGVGTGVFSISQYTSSLDYFKVLSCGTSGSSGTSSSLVDRPYSDQMNAVIKYFTDLGYTITRAINPATGNTFEWVIKW